MFWSRYNIITKSEKYGYLLYNTMSQVFLRIPEEEIGLWQELQSAPNSYTKISGGEYLLRSRIIVANQEDDVNMYVTEFLKNKYNSSDVAVTILPTRGQ